MAQLHFNTMGTIDPMTPGPMADHTPMPSPNAPRPQSLEDLPAVRQAMDAQDKNKISSSFVKQLKKKY